MEQLSKIFGTSARLKVLRLFLFNPDTAFASDQVALRAKLSPSVARKEIGDLLSSQLLRKKAVKGENRYQVNPRFPHLEALDQFIRETTAVHPQKVVSTLKRAGPLRLVALSGLFTGIVEPQVDLLVVGDSLNERVLAQAVHGLEAELGREIRYASFSTPDFRYRLGVYDRLLRDVFDYPHRLLVDKIGV